MLGRSANGLLEWKDDSGRTLKQIHEEATAEAMPSPESSEAI
jgi:hypothetical protein